MLKYVGEEENRKRGGWMRLSDTRTADVSVNDDMRDSVKWRFRTQVADSK